MVMDVVFAYNLYNRDAAQGFMAAFWILVFNVTLAIKQYARGAGAFAVVRALTGTELAYR